MTRELKSLTQLNSDSLQYLAENTNITYLAPGSISRGLVEATNAEISRLQEYIFSNQSNCYITTAAGYYLDLIGEMLGVKRLPARAGSVNASDQNIQFYVTNGILGDALPDPGNLNQGKIPSGTSISTTDGTITYRTIEDTYFPRGYKSVFVSAISDKIGEQYKVGRGKLLQHNAGVGAFVTNLKSIDNAAAAETDAEYRYRLVNSVASRPTSNELAIRLAVLGASDISNVVLQQYARGAGTFDALLVPVGNSVSFASSEGVRRSIEAVSAFGVSARVKQPDYVFFRISIQLIPQDGANLGAVDASRIRAKNAVLDYIDTIKLGGELIINRVRAAVIDSVGDRIKDINIVDLSLNGRPHVIRNIKLKPTELFTPDNTDFEAVEVI